MQNHLSVADLGYCLPDGLTLFSSLNFSFNSSRTALIGENGIGKTTLLGILAGTLAPTTGSVTRAGKISYLTQQIALNDSTTVAEVIGFARQLAAHARIARGEGTLSDFDIVEHCWDLSEKIAQYWERLGISYLTLTQPAVSLSGGELTRLRIAALLLAEPDYLILDEPTNNL